MNQDTIIRLEFHKIQDLLAEYASSEGGKRLVQELSPSCDYVEIESWLLETEEALELYYQKGGISFQGVKNIQPILGRLNLGGILSIQELRKILSLLSTTKHIRQYGQEYKGTLQQNFQQLKLLPPLKEELDRCLLEDNEVADDASPRLRDIRKGKRHIHEKIHQQLASYISGSLRTYLQDGLITTRNGRYCVPVKAEYKSKVSGMVHDQSATGSTFFIEPMGIVKLNNDLKTYEKEEEEEITKILATLSQLCADYKDDLYNNYLELTHLDFIFAKAFLASKMKANRPSMNQDKIIDLRKALHPLLEPQKVVPIDIALGENYQQLIITGPNTGGKTVSLKTVGLLSLMAQSGLFIPAAPGSRLNVFQNILVDIGDKQSIEQSLSTFSAHMVNIVQIMKLADENSLVLFDELGSGTDPTEGAALARALLTDLLHRGTITMATTHYTELKMYALSTHNVENASCEFDVESLRPTYRIKIGLPGKSNAFVISRKLGLEQRIIEDATSLMESSDTHMEDILHKLSMKEKQLEESSLKNEQLEKKLKEKEDFLLEELDKLEERKAKFINEAKEKATEILEEAKSYADKNISLFNQYFKGKEISEMEKARQGLGQALKEVRPKSHLKTPLKVAKKGNQLPKVTIGDSVRVLSLNVTGTVASLPNQNQQIFVQMGILKSQVSLDDIELLEDKAIPRQKKSSSGSLRKNQHISPEINLIGKRGEVAMEMLDKYLDDACLSHLKEVRIVHGKGSGILRKLVQEHLKKQPYIASFREGAFGEGDSGVTIAVFK